jgi:hypothetical protein
VVNASRKRTGQEHGECILMTNHGVAAVTIFCLSRPSVRSVFCGCTLLYYTVGEYSVKFLLLGFSLTENGNRT